MAVKAKNRKINGEVFKLENYAGTKNQAKKTAGYYAKNGFKVRVIKLGKMGQYQWGVFKGKLKKNYKKVGIKK